MNTEPSCVAVTRGGSLEVPGAGSRGAGKYTVWTVWRQHLADGSVWSLTGTLTPPKPFQVVAYWSELTGGGERSGGEEERLGLCELPAKLQLHWGET